MERRSYDDEELLESLRSRTLPYSAWDHRAHVRVGFLLLGRHGPDEALTRLRALIQRYNDANAEHVRTGYHETVTRAFLALIASARTEADDAQGSGAFCDANPHLLDPHVLLEHYSHELLFGARARVEWVPPDRAPLPG